MMQRVTQGSRAFAYIHVNRSVGITENIALIAKINQCEFLSGTKNNLFQL